MYNIFFLWSQKRTEFVEKGAEKFSDRSCLVIFRAAFEINALCLTSWSDLDRSVAFFIFLRKFGSTPELAGENSPSNSLSSSWGPWEPEAAPEDRWLCIFIAFLFLRSPEGLLGTQRTTLMSFMSPSWSSSRSLLLVFMVQFNCCLPCLIARSILLDHRSRNWR